MISRYLAHLSLSVSLTQKLKPIFGSNRSPRRRNVGSLSVCLLTLCNNALRMPLKEFLHHSKEQLYRCYHLGYSVPIEPYRTVRNSFRALSSIKSCTDRQDLLFF